MVSQVLNTNRGSHELQFTDPLQGQPSKPDKQRVVGNKYQYSFLAVVMLKTQRFCVCV